MSDSTISVHELWRRLHADSSAPWYLLDVRNEDEFARWPVEGAAPTHAVNIPYFAFIDDPDAALARVPRDAGEAVVLCAKGDSSEFVKDVLREAGLQAVHVGGGMAAWGRLHVPLPIPGDDRLEVWQVNRCGKGCLSYLVSSGSEAIVIDPSRFTAVYEDLAVALGARIVATLDTHVHADHVSGGARLAERAGARYWNPLSTAQTGDVLGIGRVRDAVRVLRTPGHTPESTSFLIGAHHLVTGDTLFVGGVGRPDLGGALESWGRMLHASLRDVIAPLPASTVVLPAHFASAREAHGDGAVHATLGAVRRTVPELMNIDVDEFLAGLAAHARSAPPEYQRILAANRTLVDPGEVADAWELGKNECAASAARLAPDSPEQSPISDRPPESANA